MAREALVVDLGTMDQAARTHQQTVVTPRTKAAADIEWAAAADLGGRWPAAGQARLTYRGSRS